MMKILKLIILISFLIIISCNTVKTSYDKAIKKFLDRENYSYLIDEEGDFIVKVTLEDEREDVIVRSRLNEYNGIFIREIFTIVKSFDGAISQKYNTKLESLMIDAYNNRVLGSWELIHDTNRAVKNLIFIVKAEKNASWDFLKAAIDESINTAIKFKKILSFIEENEN